jgi:hypothetical protein
LGSSTEPCTSVVPLKWVATENQGAAMQLPVRLRL